jgi:site-specific DNA-methyltransferase (adenine-specific)
MRELPDGSADLIVTSPPYWVDTADPFMAPCLLRSGDGAVPDTYVRLLDLLCRCFAECGRVLKPGGMCCVNVASTRVKGTLYPLPFDLAIRLLAAGWVLQEEICWRRWRGWDRRAGTLIQKPCPGYWYPNRVWEYVLVFKKADCGPPLWADRTQAEREASRIDTGPLYRHEVANNIWNILPVQPHAKRGHPCPFPEELPARLIELYSYKGDLVLDPFSGSGTTGRVARMLGRRFVGYEQNPAFARLALARLDDSSPLRRERRVCRFETLPVAADAEGRVPPPNPASPEPSVIAHR